MVRNTHVGFVVAAGVAVLSLGALATAGEDGATDAVDWSKRAVGAWGKTCQKCHAVPDSSYETDRAFLGQIMETT